ncbi:MAG: zinc ribbon domain-containing protein [Clostridia bacterium]
MDENMTGANTAGEAEAPKEEEASPASEKSENEGYKFCTRCGRKLSADAAYCDGCGHMQKGANPTPVIVGSYKQKKSYRPEKISDIIGKERKYYNEKFTFITEADSPACWNWYACLGWYWYAYRKMPVEAIVFFAAYCILGAIPGIGWLFKAGLLVANGAFGNYVYLKHIERTIDRIESLPVNMRESAVREYGGVSGLLLIIAFVLFGIIIGGLNIFDMFIGYHFNPLWYIRSIF